MNPNKMTEFEILARSGFSRTGLFRLPRAEISTPAFLCPTSRGIIPHLTPDNLDRCGKSVQGGAFLAAEDFFDKAESPFVKYEDKFRPLLGIPENIPMFVGARRCVPVPSPQSNSDKSISVMTAEGFRTLEMSQYNEFVHKLGADVVLAVPDIPNLSPEGRPGSNRAKKMVTRTSQWIEDVLKGLPSETESACCFVPVLPGISGKMQEGLQSFWTNNMVKGVTFWGATPARLTPKQAEQAEKRHKAKEIEVKIAEKMDPQLKSKLEESFAYVSPHTIPSHLVRFYATGVPTPQAVLQLIAEGYDLVMGSCVTDFTDAGVALDFTFPATEAHPAIGYNMWDTTYAIDMTSLGRANTQTTAFYARAYIHHLLQAREMTAWVVLQMHNFAVFDNFFKGIRQCIQNGTFEHEVQRFKQIYGSTESALELREKFRTKNSGPKIRGYQASLETENERQGQGKSRKLNDPNFRRL